MPLPPQKTNKHTHLTQVPIQYGTLTLYLQLLYSYKLSYSSTPATHVSPWIHAHTHSSVSDSVHVNCFSRNTHFRISVWLAHHCLMKPPMTTHLKLQS